MGTIKNRTVNWLKTNRENIVRNSFILPILLVVIMSISHVVSWYSLGNPISWAIYLSVAIEIFALASISAASINASKATIWILFGIVTAIQMIGNIFYEFNKISELNESFKSWVNLIDPFFINWDILDHKRLLAIIQGGTLPILSLTALHFYIQFNDKVKVSTHNIDTEDIEDLETIEPKTENTDVVTNIINTDIADLSLTDEDISTIIEASENPLPPNDALKSAALDYKDIIPESKEVLDSPINDKSKIVESGSGLPGNNVRSDKGNNATISKARKEINPKTGRFS